jgi:phage terminase large subunit
MTRITIPNNWTPRAYQMPLWRYLTAGGLRAVSRWHRRSGKDDVYLNHTCRAAIKRPGTYWYLLPEYAQARKSMWDAINPHTGKRRIDQAFPQEIRTRYNEQEMKIGLPSQGGESVFQLVGADNFNSLVGSPPIGLVFSEYALANPSAWAYLQPILMENGGWAAFNSTPRGKNHYKSLCELASDRVRRKPDGSVDPSGWFYDVVTVEQSGVFTDEQLQEVLVELQKLHGDDFGRALWMQEYFVSFDAAIPGSIFGGQIEMMRSQGRIGLVPFEETVPVHTGWDLGYDDDTAIWWYQVFAGEVRFIDYLATNFKDIPWYVDRLQTRAQECGYRYGTHWLPHDARPATLAAGGKSILQQFNEHNEKLGGALGAFAIAPKLDKQEQIQAANATMRKAWIDEDLCYDGLEALTNYRREWDEEARVFSPKPVHDWSSHGCDGFMTVAVSWRQNPKPKPEVALPRPGTLVGKHIAANHFGQLKTQHLKRMRENRTGMRT